MHDITWLLIEKAKSDVMIYLLFNLMDDKYKSYEFIRQDHILNYKPIILFNKYAEEGKVDVIKFFKEKNMLEYTNLDTRSVLNSDNIELLELTELDYYNNDDFIHCILCGKTVSVDYLKSKFPNICKITKKQRKYLSENTPWNECPHDMIKKNNLRGMIYYIEYMKSKIDYFSLIEITINNNNVECLKLLIESHDSINEKKFIDKYDRENFKNYMVRWGCFNDNDAFNYLYPV